MALRNPHHPSRPTPDELVVRYQLMKHVGIESAPGVVPPCRDTDGDMFYGQASAYCSEPNADEVKALGICATCPIPRRCLFSEIHAAPTAFDVIGVRAGLRQVERRALLRALDKAGVQR